MTLKCHGIVAVFISFDFGVKYEPGMFLTDFMKFTTRRQCYSLLKIIINTLTKSLLVFKQKVSTIIENHCEMKITVDCKV